uniref:EXS domain-containing protein n=1 Tax=Macrostomum lignano TaxID=282301 RepID=A0A1I8FA51_9PLAT
EADLLWRQVGLQPLHRTEFYHIARLLLARSPLTLLLSAGMFGAIWRHRAEFFPAAVGDACPRLRRRNLRRMGDWLMFVLFLALIVHSRDLPALPLVQRLPASFLLAALLWTAGRLHFRRRGLRWQVAGWRCTRLATWPASSCTSSRRHQKFDRGLRANSTTASPTARLPRCTSPTLLARSEFASPLLILVFYFYLALQIYLHDRGPYRADYKSILTVDMHQAGDFSSEPMKAPPGLPEPAAHCHGSVGKSAAAAHPLLPAPAQPPT